MADLLELQTNIPVTVALAFADGKEYASKIAGAPPQVMFTLVDGRRVFWPQPFAESIRNAGITAGQPFEVVKREAGKGKTQLQFRPVATPPPPPAPAWEGPPAQPHEPAKPQAAAPAVPALTPQSQRFMAAYKDSIDVLLEAKAYAQRQGLALEIRCEDVRALAATIMIEASKGGR